VAHEVQQDVEGSTMGKAYLVASGSKLAGKKVKGKMKEKVPPKGVIVPGRRRDLCTTMDDTCQWSAQVRIHFFLPCGLNLVHFDRKLTSPARFSRKSVRYCQKWRKGCRRSW